MILHCFSQWQMGPTKSNSTLNVNTLRLTQNGCHFADDVLKCIFLNENVWITIGISLKFVQNDPINNMTALVQIMAWCEQVTSHYLNQWWLIINNRSLKITNLKLQMHLPGTNELIYCPLVMLDTKPLPEPMLNYSQLNYEWNFNHKTQGFFQ